MRTSKTGLLPSQGRNKNLKPKVQKIVTLEVPGLVGPAPFKLRPFAGVYNPFPYGCSILCNHPAELEAKSIVKKAKDVWVTEGRSLIELEELSSFKHQEKRNRQHQNKAVGDQDDRVPEELFRKYTDTDSRPVTPAPTLISIDMKASQVATENLRARRCMTPDPTSFLPTKEKTLLVLDLRRSHSQETVCWQGGQPAESNFEGAMLRVATTSRTTSPSDESAGQSKKRKTPRIKAVASATSSILKAGSASGSDPKVQTRNSPVNQSSSKEPIRQEPETSNHKFPQLSPRSGADGLNTFKRRGKKKRGTKTGKDGLKEFQGIPDPRETQVSAVEDDSKEGSLTPSFRGAEKFQENDVEEFHESNVLDQRNKSFLNTDILTQLQRQLDKEIVDSEMNAKRKMALEEALRYKINPKQTQQGEEMKRLKKEFQLCIKDSERWLLIPRVFTRRSARFEIPMDSRLLNNMTPLEYVQKYVYASPERLVLYNHVFNLHKEEPEDDEEKERMVLGKVITLKSLQDEMKYECSNHFRGEYEETHLTDEPTETS